jgi:thymidine phosphorylase
MLHLTGQVPSLEHGEKLIKEVLESGKAIKSFYEILIFQGVPETIAKNLCLGKFRITLPQAKVTGIPYNGNDGNCKSIKLCKTT